MPHVTATEGRTYHTPNQKATMDAIEEGVVYTRGTHYGDPIWIVEDYGDGLYLCIFDYSRGKRSADLRVYTTSFKETVNFIALDPEDQDQFKLTATLTVIKELSKRTERKAVRKQIPELWMD